MCSEGLKGESSNGGIVGKPGGHHANLPDIKFLITSNIKEDEQ